MPRFLTCRLLYGCSNVPSHVNGDKGPGEISPILSILGSAWADSIRVLTIGRVPQMAQFPRQPNAISIRIGG